MRRAIDYLASRPELDRERIAFYGLSMGAEEGLIVGAVEHRMRTLVLVAAGLSDDLPAEVDGLHFAPRVRVPVLMINGRYDFISPLETNQQPLFRLLGAKPSDKKHVRLRLRARSSVARRGARDARLAGPLPGTGGGPAGSAAALSRGASGPVQGAVAAGRSRILRTSGIGRPPSATNASWNCLRVAFFACMYSRARSWISSLPSV